MDQSSSGTVRLCYTSECGAEPSANANGCQRCGTLIKCPKCGEERHRNKKNVLAPFCIECYYPFPAADNRSSSAGTNQEVDASGNVNQNALEASTAPACRIAAPKASINALAVVRETADQMEAVPKLVKGWAEQHSTSPDPPEVHNVPDNGNSDAGLNVLVAQVKTLQSQVTVIETTLKLHEKFQEDHKNSSEKCDIVHNYFQKISLPEIPYEVARRVDRKDQVGYSGQGCTANAGGPLADPGFLAFQCHPMFTEKEKATTEEKYLALKIPRKESEEKAVEEENLAPKEEFESLDKDGESRGEPLTLHNYTVDEDKVDGDILEIDDTKQDCASAETDSSGFSISWLLDNLETVYKRVPDKVYEIIYRFCDENSVVTQSPDDWNTILVMGVNAESIQTNIDEELQSAGYVDEFHVVTKNATSPITTKELALITIQKKTRDRFHSDSWLLTAVATTELLVAAKIRNKDVPTHERAVYAVAPAHMMLSDLQRETATNIASFDNSTRSIRDDVEKATTSHRYVCRMQKGKHEEIIDLRHPPLLSYRQMFAKNSRCPVEHPLCKTSLPTQFCPHMCANDVALLPIDYNDAARVHKALYATQRPMSIVPVTRIEHLMLLIGQKVIVRGIEGQIVPYNFGKEREAKTDAKTNGVTDAVMDTVTSAYMLTFTLCTPAALREGDSGSLVYVKGPLGTLAPLGMLMKKTTVSLEDSIGHEYYHAVILQQALQDIEMEYPHHVADIKVFSPKAEKFSNWKGCDNFL